MDNIGDRIKCRRKELKMSQDELAERINANRVTISCYENGKYTPSTQAVIELASALNVPVSFLLGNETAERAPIAEADLRYALFGGREATDKQFREVMNFAQYVLDRKPWEG